MIITIHQPDFLPWLGFFDRWLKSSIYIVLDDVQFIRRGWQHRDKIKTSNGVQWLTVPIIKKGRYYQKIKDVEINNKENWRKRHLDMIQHAYQKAPNFNSVYISIKEILNKNHKLLIDLNIDLLKFCAKTLHIETPLIFSSSLELESQGTERLIQIVTALRGNTYLTGPGSKDYLDEEAFCSAGIDVLWHNYKPPVYPQLYNDFEEKLSIIDFLMMVSEPKEIFWKKSKDYS